MKDVSDIAGAVMVMFFYGRPYTRLMVWDDFGELYNVIDNYTIKIYMRIDATNLSNTFAFDFYDLQQLSMIELPYNAILGRIEDLYGMSISEFSLGQLEYV